MTEHKAVNDLSQKDHDLLWGVFHFGGYCNSYIATLATVTSRQNTLNRLNSLLDRSYLRKVLIDFRRTTPHVFQVTAKTCRLFHNPNTNLRKNHASDYIIRGLLKYLFYIEHRSLPFIVSNDDKIGVLLETGYSREMIPYKENLSTRNMQSSRVYWIEELMISHRGEIYLFFIDREPRHPYNQLRVLFKAYERVLGHDHRKIRFHVVVANDRRKAEYLRVIRRSFVFPVDRPDEERVENYDQFIDRITSTKTRPKDHLSLRDINMKILRTKTDLFSRDGV